MRTFTAHFKDMVKSRDSILKDYQNHVEIQETLVRSLKKALNIISYTRLGLFITEIIFVAIIISVGYYWPIGVLMCLPVLAFVLVLKKQATLQAELNYAEKLLLIFKNEVGLILTGKQQYDDGSAFADENHPYASDLDIYGPSSLYAQINRSNTLGGMQLLASSLGSLVHSEQIKERQEAITELRDDIIATFHFRAGLQSHKPAQLEIIKDKMGHQMPEQLGFIHAKGLRTYTSLVPFISLGMLALGICYGGVAWSFLSAYVLLNFGITFFNGKHITAVSDGFSGSSELLTAVSGTVKWMEDRQWRSSYIKNMFVEDPAYHLLSRQISKLSAIINAFDAGRNMFVGPFLKGLLLWDFRCAIRLDQWYTQSARRLSAALETIGKLEELISFATLAHNQPDWVQPVITGTFHFEAAAMGHPLISADKRIRNSYVFEKRPVVDIITGSNMAGKSTFLRTVGINMVLAYAGAPVCAASLKLSVFNILTYMRIKDSLNDQTSTFKAELNRLKMILEGTKILSHPLVLIDEMLRGTNSKDKYLGSRVFIQQMIKEHTPTLFATHDLQLSDMTAAYPQEVRNYHFDIQLAAGEMNFDYKLKHGACKTFNAALLLQEIGLSFNSDEHI
jgi:hypothetical protein